MPGFDRTTGIDRVWLDLTRLYRIWQDLTRFVQIWQDLTRFDKIWQYLIRSDKIQPDCKIPTDLAWLFGKPTTKRNQQQNRNIAGCAALKMYFQLLYVLCNRIQSKHGMNLIFKTLVNFFFRHSLWLQITQCTKSSWLSIS